MNNAQSNRLTSLAADIRTAHKEVARSSKLLAERAVDAGRLLAEAKASEDIPRGGWERWVEKVAGVPYRTAQHYIQLFVAVEDGSATLQDIAEAGQKGALKAAGEDEADNEAEPDDNPEGEQDGEPSGALIWTEDQLERRVEAVAGTCVVANMRDGTDEALIAWAKENDLFVRIDRKTEWGNPFEMPDDGSREEVIGKYSKFYLPHKDGLLGRIPSLRGKVLGCWCHPAECHGDIIAEIVDREADGEGSAEDIAEQIAEVDG